MHHLARPQRELNGAQITAANLAKVKVGQPCEVQLDALPGMRFRATVSRVVPTVDRSKATVLVKVQFVDKGLWGSSSSRYEPLLWKRFKYAEVFRRIAVTIGEPLPGATATPEGLRERVLALRGGRP